MDRHIFRITAIRIAARCEEIAAEILCSAAGRAKYPANTHPVADFVPADCGANFFNMTDHFVPWNNGKPRWRRATLYFIKLRVADATNGYTEQNFILCRNRSRQLDKLQRLRVVVKRTNLLKGHCAHG